MRKISNMHIERLYFMSDLYKRIEDLCHRDEINVTMMCRESGASRASLTDLKMGRKQSLSSDTLTKIAAYFKVSVDYLLGRTEDPVDYDNNGEALAEIPLSYIEACNGDCRAARAMMLAVDDDAQKENTLARYSKGEIGFDDFTYAMQNETKGLTEEDKALLLSMARQLKIARDKWNGEPG